MEKDKVKDSKWKQLKMGHRTINNIYNKFIGKPRKIRKVFYLSELQKQKRVEFCKDIIKLNCQGNLFFRLNSNRLVQISDDSIRLSKKNEEKLKRGDLDVYELITTPKKKFEKSIKVAGGISFHGVGKLMILHGTENEFCYTQAILNYQKDIGNKDLIFEQDGAPSLTIKANINLLNKIFNHNWIQNPPNSPDLAYPIEDLWEIVKNRVKRRNPKDLEELTSFIFEDWYSVPQTLIQNLFNNYLKRIKKVLDLKGARLENEYLKQLKEIRKEGEYGEKHIWKKNRTKY